MVALAPVPGVVRIDTHWNNGPSILAADRFFLGYTGSLPTAAQLNTFATQVQGSFVSHIAALTYTGFQYTLFHVTDLSSTTGAVGSNGTAFNGTRTGTASPVSVCVLLNGHVLRRYRGGKPRMYPPWGVVGDMATSQTWNAAFISQVNAAWAATISDISVVPWAGATITGQVNVSWYSGYLPPTTLPSGAAKNHLKHRDVPLVDAISSMTCNAKLGTQRRRIAA